MFRHQGDVTFHAVKSFDESKKVKHTGSFVLALGETTGHKHVITVERPADMEMFQLATGQYVIRLKTEATVTHEEHKPVIIPPGTWRVGGEREKDWFSLATRQVLD